MKKGFAIFGLMLPILLAGCVRPEPSLNSESVSSSQSESSSTVSSSSSESSTSITSSSGQTNSSESSTSITSSASQTSSSSAVSVSTYALHGLFRGESGWTDKPMRQNPYSSSEYMILGVQLYEGDIFLIQMDEYTQYGYSAVKTSVPYGLVRERMTDDYIEVATTGIYDIYSDYNPWDDGHIYLSRTDGTSSSSSSTVGVSGVKLDRSGKFLVTRNEFTLAATVEPEDATNKDVTWSSSDKTVATVSTAGRVTATNKRGGTAITAKTADGSKTATCLVFVSPSERPDYFLTGTINGRSYGYGDYIYPGIPIFFDGFAIPGEYYIPDNYLNHNLEPRRYLIASVNLKSGDELTVTSSTGAKLKNRYNQTYSYSVTKDQSVHVFLDTKDENYSYLTLVAR